MAATRLIVIRPRARRVTIRKTGTGASGGGGGTTDHAALSSNLAWSTSGHTGTASRLASFDGGGAASFTVIGVGGVQAYDAELAALAGLTSAADSVPYFTGSGSAALATFTAFARSLADDADASAGRTTLGLGTAAVLASDDDGTLAANSDLRLATQKAVKTYVDASVVGLLDLKGSTDCSANPSYPAASKGDAYYVSVAGKIGGASGKSVDIGDVYIASADNAGGTEASVGTSWFVLEHNLTGALVAANNLSDVASASTARTNLGLAIGTDVMAYSAASAASKLLGRGSAAGAGAWQEITLGTGLSMSGTTLSSTGGVTAHTGLTALAWTSSGHTGDVQTVAGFNGSGAARYFEIGTDIQEQNQYLQDWSDGISYAQGDVFYFNGTNLTRLAAGTSGLFLMTQGAAANPTWSGDDLKAIEALASTGFAVRSASNTWVQRSIAGTSPVTVTNGDGVSGNPTISVHALLADLAASAPAQGAVWYYDGANLVKLAAGTDGQTLATRGSGANPEWQYRPVRFLVYIGTAAQTNMAATPAEIFGGSTPWRIKVDLTPYTRCRIFSGVSTAGSTGSLAAPQYSLDDGTTWYFMDGSADGGIGSETPQITIDATGQKLSAWMTMASAARAEVLIRILCDDGNGVADPVMNNLGIEVS